MSSLIWNVTVVSGAAVVPLHAPDGSYNIIKSAGTSPVGAHHRCGALYVTVSPDSTLRARHAPDGSLYVSETAAPREAQRVNVVSGSLA